MGATTGVFTAGTTSDASEPTASQAGTTARPWPRSLSPAPRSGAGRFCFARGPRRCRHPLQVVIPLVLRSARSTHPGLRLTRAVWTLPGIGGGCPASAAAARHRRRLPISSCRWRLRRRRAGPAVRAPTRPDQRRRARDPRTPPAPDSAALAMHANADDFDEDARRRARTIPDRSSYHIAFVGGRECDVRGVERPRAVRRPLVARGCRRRCAQSRRARTVVPVLSHGQPSPKSRAPFRSHVHHGHRLQEPQRPAWRIQPLTCPTKTASTRSSSSSPQTKPATSPRERGTTRSIEVMPDGAVRVSMRLSTVGSTRGCSNGAPQPARSRRANSWRRSATRRAEQQRVIGDVSRTNDDRQPLPSAFEQLVVSSLNRMGIRIGAQSKGFLRVEN